MNYSDLAAEATAEILFFSDENGTFECITQAGGVSIVNGVEVERPEVRENITGFIRNPRRHEVNGDTIRATDKLGVFTNDVNLEQGYSVFIDGEKYTIVDPRPVRQTATTLAYRPVMRRVAVNG